MILLASLTALFSMLAMNGLPKPYHPVFNVPQIPRRASRRWVLSVHRIVRSEVCQLDETVQFLREIGGRGGDACSGI